MNKLVFFLGLISLYLIGFTHSISHPRLSTPEDRDIAYDRFLQSWSLWNDTVAGLTDGYCFVSYSYDATEPCALTEKLLRLDASRNDPSALDIVSATSALTTCTKPATCQNCDVARRPINPIASGVPPEQPVGEADLETQILTLSQWYAWCDFQFSRATTPSKGERTTIDSYSASNGFSQSDEASSIIIITTTSTSTTTTSTSKATGVKRQLLRASDNVTQPSFTILMLSFDNATGFLSSCGYEESSCTLPNCFVGLNVEQLHLNTTLECTLPSEVESHHHLVFAVVLASVVAALFLVILVGAFVYWLRNRRAQAQSESQFFSSSLPKYQPLRIFDDSGTDEEDGLY